MRIQREKKENLKIENGGLKYWWIIGYAIQMVNVNTSILYNVIARVRIRRV